MNPKKTSTDMSFIPQEEGFPRATRIFTSTTTSNPSVYSERKAEDGSFLSSEVSDVSVLEELEVRPYSVRWISSIVLDLLIDLCLLQIAPFQTMGNV